MERSRFEIEREREIVLREKEGDIERSFGDNVSSERVERFERDQMSDNRMEYIEGNWPLRFHQ